MDATSKENMAKITISEEFGEAELKYSTMVNVEGGIAAPPPFKIAGLTVKFPGSVMMNKDKTLKLLLIVAMIICCLQVYNLMLLFCLQGVVFILIAMKEEISELLLYVNSVMQILVLVCYLLKAIWKGI